MSDAKDNPPADQDHISPSLRNLARPIEGLQQDPSNVRLHSEKNLGAIRASLRRFGQQKAIVVDKNGIVVAGNGTLDAAIAEGWKVIAAAETELSGPEAIAFAIADNRTAELAEWDQEELQTVLKSLDDELRSATGFLDREIDALFREEAAEDEPPPEIVPAVELGDVWKLGDHEIRCCDALDAKAIGTVPDFRLLVTSPPYWIGKEYEREQTEGEIDSFIDRAVDCWSELMPADDFRLILNTQFRTRPVKGKKSTGMDLLLNRWASRMEKSDWYMRHCRIWSKSTGYGKGAGLISDRVFMGWEFIATFAKCGARHRGMEPTPPSDSTWAQQGVMTLQGDRGGSEHETHGAAFPVELPARFMRLYTRPAECVFDPFLGLGTTVIAGEQMGRSVVGVEISPVYCDVAVRRWMAISGKAATLDGVAYQEVRSSRVDDK